jgi:hypothetical protein
MVTAGAAIGGACRPPRSRRAQEDSLDMFATAVENERLARRLSGMDMKPLRFPLPRVDDPAVMAVLAAARVRRPLRHGTARHGTARARADRSAANAAALPAERVVRRVPAQSHGQVPGGRVGSFQRRCQLARARTHARSSRSTSSTAPSRAAATTRCCLSTKLRATAAAQVAGRAARRGRALRAPDHRRSRGRGVRLRRRAAAGAGHAAAEVVLPAAVRRGAQGAA